MRSDVTHHKKSTCNPCARPIPAVFSTAEHHTYAFPPRHDPSAPRRRTVRARVDVRHEPHGSPPSRHRVHGRRERHLRPRTEGHALGRTAHSHRRIARATHRVALFVAQTTTAEGDSQAGSTRSTPVGPRPSDAGRRCRISDSATVASFACRFFDSERANTLRGGGAAVLTSQEEARERGFESRPRVAGRCGPQRHRFSSRTKWSRVRVPLGAPRAPVAQSEEHFRAVTS
jgi:hypothetical protein